MRYTIRNLTRGGNLAEELFHPEIVPWKGIKGQAAIGSHYFGGQPGLIPPASHQAVAGHDPAHEKDIWLILYNFQNNFPDRGI